MRLWGKIGRRKAVVTVVVFAVVAILGLTAFVVRKNVLDAARCEEVTAFIESEGAVIESGNGELDISIIGDSYSAGDLLDDYNQGWAHQLPNYVDATTHVAGVGATGFLAEGPCGDQRYATRVSDAAQGADVLILQGGLNDSVLDNAEAASAADATVKAATSVPRVVIVGPVDAPAIDGEAGIDEQLAAIAKLNGREYVSALDWDLEFLPDRVHLTPAGHQEFAELVAAAL